MTVSQTRYVRSFDGAHIAYRTWGEGGPTHLFLSEFNATVDTRDLHPALLRFWHYLARLGTVVAFDRRGLGASERLSGECFSDLDAWVADMVAVLDAVGAEHAVISAEGSSAPVAIKFAAEHPDRTLRLALVNGVACGSRREGYPCGGFSAAEIDALADAFGPTWGSGAFLSQFAPGLATDPDFVAACAFTERHVGPPSTMQSIMRSIATYDARDLAPLVAVPSFVCWTGDHFGVPVEQSRDLAQRLPGCTFVEGEASTFYEPGSEPLQAWGDFIAGESGRDIVRKLTTLVFLDVVGSTDLIAQVGDAKWSQVLGDLDSWVARELHRFEGVLVKHTGDGYLARFDVPGTAVRAAVAIATGAHVLGVEVRCGVHTGEVELRRGSDVGGLSVHIAARVMDAAQAREVLVSRTVRDLLAGSEFELDDRGQQALRGVPGEWHLYAVRRRGLPA